MLNKMGKLHCIGSRGKVTSAWRTGWLGAGSRESAESAKAMTVVGDPSAAYYKTGLAKRMG